MIDQTVLPAAWVIVSDGSTDRTDQIVRGYENRYPWIRLVRMPEHIDRQFAAKVYAFNEGYNTIKNREFEIIGNLDADLTFLPDYFEFLLGKFIDDPALGVAGTPFFEEESKGYDYRFSSIEHVSGACQLFRKKCYEDIGGYTPIKGGGIDWVAVTSARMNGWKTRTFTEKSLLHHRKMGTGRGNILSARFRLGTEDYYLGSHPLWELTRALYQMQFKPYILGGLMLYAGYVVAALKKTKRPIPDNLVRFYRAEQMGRLKGKIKKAVRISK